MKKLNIVNKMEGIIVEPYYELLLDDNISKILSKVDLPIKYFKDINNSEYTIRKIDILLCNFIREYTSNWFPSEKINIHIIRMIGSILLKITDTNQECSDDDIFRRFSNLEFKTRPKVNSEGIAKLNNNLMALYTKIKYSEEFNGIFSDIESYYYTKSNLDNYEIKIQPYTDFNSIMLPYITEHFRKYISINSTKLNNIAKRLPSNRLEPSTFKWCLNVYCYAKSYTIPNIISFVNLSTLKFTRIREDLNFLSDTMKGFEYTLGKPKLSKVKENNGLTLYSYTRLHELKDNQKEYTDLILKYKIKLYNINNIVR